MKKFYKEKTEENIDLPHAESLSREPTMESLMEIGMETSFSGTFELLCNNLRHKTKTFQNNIRSEMNTKLNQLNIELNSLKSGSNARNNDIMHK